jgi:biopolymer transport protein ExbB
MTKIQASIKQGEIEEAIATCDKQQGSVANAIKSALIKYQAVKKKVSIVKKQQRLFTKKLKLHLEMPMLQKNMTIISSLVSEHLLDC